MCQNTANNLRLSFTFIDKRVTKPLRQTKRKNQNKQTTTAKKNHPGRNFLRRLLEHVDEAVLVSRSLPKISFYYLITDQTLTLFQSYSIDKICGNGRDGQTLRLHPRRMHGFFWEAFASGAAHTSPHWRGKINMSGQNIEMLNIFAVFFSAHSSVIDVILVTLEPSTSRGMLQQLMNKLQLLSFCKPLST